MKRQQSCTPNTGNGGNYYNFRAAIGGIGGGTTFRKAENSVCAKGWSLSNQSGKKSYADLTNTYFKGLSNSGKVSNIGRNPLSFLRSGEFDNGARDRENLYGLYWTGATGNSTNAYYLRYFYAASTYGFDAQYAAGRTFGFPVRCVAR